MNCMCITNITECSKWIRILNTAIDCFMHSVVGTGTFPRCGHFGIQFSRVVLFCRRSYLCRVRDTHAPKKWFHSHVFIYLLMVCNSIRGIMTGIYATNSPEACRHVASDSRANIIVVENQKQLDKILQVIQLDYPFYVVSSYKPFTIMPGFVYR